MLFGISPRCTALLLAGVFICCLSGCSLRPAPDSSSGSSLAEDSASTSLSAGAASSSASSEAEESSSVPPVPTPSPKEDQPSIPVIQPVPYDFSQPVPASEAVDNSYFADAAFVGDSRTDGLLLFSGMGCGTNLTSNGLSIFQLSEKKALTIDGQKYTLLEALAMEQYGKVYISLGVNELGIYDDEGFYSSYCQAIDQIRACQPNAVIYIQGLIPLNEDVIAQTTKRDYLTNEHLIVYNDIMKRVAQEKQVAFLDLHTEFVDENGELSADASNDGVHLRRDGYKQWLAYLKTHTVSYETLYASQPVLPDQLPGPIAPATPVGSPQTVKPAPVPPLVRPETTSPVKTSADLLTPEKDEEGSVIG